MNVAAPETVRGESLTFLSIVVLVRGMLRRLADACPVSPELPES